MISLRFQMKKYPCNIGLKSRYDIVAFSPPVHTETSMKMQTFEYANQIGNATTCKRNDMKTHPCNRGHKFVGGKFAIRTSSII